MKTSAASIIITPPIGIPLAGNGRADSASRGIHDELYANFIYLESGTERLLFIGMDLLGLARPECDEIKARVTAATGIAAQNINIVCTHTHSGPNTMNIFSYFMSEQEKLDCRNYLNWLVETVAGSAIAAIADAAEGYMGYGRDIVEGFSFCRRVVLKDGTVKMIFEDYDPEDIDHLTGPNGHPIMNIFIFTDALRTIQSILVHYTSHPAVVCGEDWLYTRDYVHSLTVELQKRYGKGVVVLYANGAQGNQVAADPYLPFTTGWAESARVGRGMAEGAKRIISRILMKKELRQDVTIRTAATELMLPIRRISAEEQAKVKELLAHLPDKVLLHGLDPRVEATSIQEMADYPVNEEPIPLQAVSLDEQVIVTVPSETFLEIGIQIMNSTERDLMVFGLANDYVGYIPTAEAFSEGGYEIKTSKGSSRFDPVAGARLAEACIALAKRV